MKNRILLICLLIIGSIHPLKAQEAEFKTWYVADAKVACQVGDAMTSCLHIRENPDSNWQNFSFDIEGFNHEKGFEYIIEVRLDKIKYTEVNGPQYKYTLVRIVSKKSTVHLDKRLLMNNTFHLINIDQYNKKTLAMRAKPFLIFNPDSNSISGFSGCNNFAGPCSYANAFMQFGTMEGTIKACAFSEIETKFYEALKGKATFYVRSNMLYIVCENFMTLHLRPEKSLDSMLRVIEKEKEPKNDVNFIKNEDGTYRVNAPAMHGKNNLFFTYRPAKLTKDELKKIKLKLVPVDVNPEISEVIILTKAHEKNDMYYAIITYKNGTKKEMEIRDAN